MDTGKIDRWLSLGGNLAVLIGLVLVAYQINQEARLQKIQLFSDATTAINEFNLAMLGDNPTRVVARSIEDPDSLTLSEFQVMDAYLATALYEIRRLEILRREGLLAEGSMYGIHHYWFGSNYAKAWFAEMGTEGVFPVNVDQIRRSDPEYVLKYYRNLLERLEDGPVQDQAQ